MPWWRWKVSTTWSPSFLRMRPVSTNTHVSCEPMALCTSAAATAESTPPDRPQMARASPTWARIASTDASMKLDMVQSPGRPARSCRNRVSRSWPWGVWATSGWYCTPQIRRSGASITAAGAPSEAAVATKPSGTSTTASKWLIHTVWLSGRSSVSRVESAPAMRCTTVRPYSPAPPPPTLPPSCWAMSWAP